MFSFACGWLINKTLGYNHGGKIVFAVIVASSFVSVIMISLFNEFFGFSYLLVESMILYILRNITLGAMAFFGMALSEVIILQKEAAGKSKNDNTQKTVETSQREVQLIIDEAKLKAEKIVYEAQQRADDLIERKSQIERRLKEFIAVEREIIKNYESEEE
jgi:cell division septum initiation protein DivIVA